MLLKVVMRAAVAFAGLTAGSLVMASDRSTLVVSNVDELLAAQQVVGAPAKAESKLVTVKVLAGTYVLKDSFRIARSHVALLAEKGAKFVLASNINEPVIAVGSQNEVAGAADVITDVVIMGLEIDGNKDHQTSEYSARRPWIRNNGIDVRAVNQMKVANVIANNNRSGGLVISWGCSDIFVADSTFAKNYFDGIAFYASTGVEVKACTMTQNKAAGISLDNEFVDSRFVDCIITGNGDVGIFARSSARLEFKNCTVQRSGNWAIFLAHDGGGQGVYDVTIAGGEISGNRGGVCMASVSEKQSHGTRVVGARFADNEGNGRRNFATSGAMLETSEIDSTGKVIKTINLATMPGAIR